jgi:hypothetical protein
LKIDGNSFTARYGWNSSYPLYLTNYIYFDIIGKKINILFFKIDPG